MSAQALPFISVITPFYNTAPYLVECIESVLAQTHQNFEYVLLNNCSTDGSREIAERYARKDSRIRLLDNTRLLPQLENYNEALRQISPDSRYCKMVQADDWMWPRCLEDMAALAEANPRAGMVGAYTFLGRRTRGSVYLDGLPYYSAVTSGREICRRFLLQGTYVFGSPTASMVRSEIVRGRPAFYDVDNVVADVDICLDILQDWDFGFVYQVLTYTRRDNESLMSVLRTFHLMLLAEFLGIHKYGPIFLTPEETRRRKAELRRRYLFTLGESLLRRREKAFWDFHKRALEAAGLRWDWWKVRWYSALAAMSLVLNPLDTSLKLGRWYAHRHSPVE